MNSLRRMLQYLEKYRWRLVGAFLCAVGVAGLSAVYAWLVQPVLDGVFIERNQELLIILPLVVLGVACLKAFFSYSQAYLMSYVGQWLVSDVRQELFLHMARLPVPFHDSQTSGKLIARVISDVNEMANSIPNVLKDGFQQGLTFIALTGVAFYRNWKLATIVFIVLPLSTLVLIKVGKRIRSQSTRGQESIGRMASVLKEAFSGIKIVKAYGQEEQEAGRFFQTNKSFRTAKIKSSQAAALTSPVLEVIGVCGVAIIIWYGGGLVIDGAMKPGEFFSFLFALFMAYTPLRRMSGANESIQRALASAQRVFDVLDMESELIKDAGKKPLPPIKKCLEFSNVSFVYEGTSDLVLDSINLSVNVGEMVALVGASGSGKTTLVSLVPRFYDPTRGIVRIDGEDIRLIDRRSLRQQIGIVSQDTLLFEDSIRNNIAYSRPDASEERIREAAQAANAWEFIERLPQGLETLIGENGLKLSGGQRQRLAIARAILRDPPLLILDEATSALDSESESLVQEALANLVKARTTLVIAHRLSTVQHADRIVVLHQGKIEEMGTHSELFRRSGLYTRLYQTQFQYSQMDPVHTN